MQEFPDNESCLKEILYRKYPNFICKCGRTKLYRLKNRPVYACACGFQLNPLVGTPMQNTKIPLTYWFYVIYVMSQTKSGVSAASIQRHLGVKYETAWRMMMKIREVMTDIVPLTGAIEADETYMRAKPWRTVRPLAYNGRAQTVFGIIERGGRAKAFVIPTNSKYYLLKTLETNIDKPAVIYTDGYTAYQDLGKKYNHKTIQHSKGEYVNGEIHTNTIENLWSQIKRGLQGVYRVVHPEYLQHYLDEYTWRYSHRFDKSPMFYLLLKECH